MNINNFVYWFMGAFGGYFDGNNIPSDNVKRLVKHCVDSLDKRTATPEQLAYYINGYYETLQSQNKPYTAFDTMVIEHLKLVFNKVTPTLQKPPTVEWNGGKPLESPKFNPWDSQVAIC